MNGVFGSRGDPELHGLQKRTPGFQPDQDPRCECISRTDRVRGIHRRGDDAQRWFGARKDCTGRAGGDERVLCAGRNERFSRRHRIGSVRASFFEIRLDEVRPRRKTSLEGRIPSVHDDTPVRQGFDQLQIERFRCVERKRARQEHGLPRPSARDGRVDETPAVLSSDVGAGLVHERRRAVVVDQRDGESSFPFDLDELGANALISQAVTHGGAGGTSGKAHEEGISAERATDTRRVGALAAGLG
jgi:hypothetical protein